MFDHLTAGIEEICGHRGNNFFRVHDISIIPYFEMFPTKFHLFGWQEKIEHIDELYLRPIFTRSTDKNSLQRLFEKLTLSWAEKKRIQQNAL